MGSTIQLDNATYTESGDAEARIRPPTCLNIFRIGFLGIILLFVLALLLSIILDAVSGEQPLDILALLFVGICAVFLTYVIYYIYNSAKRPPVTINRNTRLIDIGRGSNTRTLSFDDVMSVTAEPIKLPWSSGVVSVVLFLFMLVMAMSSSGNVASGKGALASHGIYLRLKSGESVLLCTVSGSPDKSQSTAQTIIRSIAAFTGLTNVAPTSPGELQ